MPEDMIRIAKHICAFLHIVVFLFFAVQNIRPVRLFFSRCLHTSRFEP